MNAKSQFVQTIQILAPNDSIIHQAAKSLPADSLPSCSEGALQFVVTMQKGLGLGGFRQHVKMGEAKDEVLLSVPHAIRIKSAEYWLKLGEDDEALKELQKLPKKIWNHRAVVKARVAAMGILRERTQLDVVE
jgi:hypothetical protein